MAMTAARAQGPPLVYQLAAHPVRWRLLHDLAYGDHRVRELVRSARESQSLVSYHLRRLRTAGLVVARRSSFDGRDTYYSLDLDRCGALLVDAGSALHPALTLGPDTGPGPRLRRSRSPRVLFLCTGNSARSQIAQGLLETLGAGRVEVASAGSHPKALHPNAVRVMRARGIDISTRTPRHFDDLAGRRFDYVVSLCDRVREVCPEFLGAPRLIHWSIADPAAEAGSDRTTYPAFERAAAQLETRIRVLLHRIDDEKENGS